MKTVHTQLSLDLVKRDYALGLKAGLSQGKSANPYMMGTLANFAWSKGFVHAQSVTPEQIIVEYMHTHA